MTVAVPVLNEERHLRACLESIVAQTYRGELEILVVDGGSTDGSRAIAASFPEVRVLENPRRLQAAALNIALDAASGDVFVRVDGHSTIGPEFVERSVEALTRTGAAMVGAALHPRADGPWLERAIGAAIVSPLGAGPAPFRLGGPSRWVDTVFLSSFKTETLRDAGGYEEDPRVNEDPELAHRLSSQGGVWYEQTLESVYIPQGSLGGLARQYFRYGKLRAGTFRRHPSSLAARQLVAPIFVASLLTPWRRAALGSYACLVVGAASRKLPRDPAAAAGVALALPCMHVPWAIGFFSGLLRRA